MTNSLKEKDFTQKVGDAGGIKDHTHAFALMENFLDLGKDDQEFFANAGAAASLIEGNKNEIRKTLLALDEPEKLAEKSNFLLLKGRISTKETEHKLRKRVAGDDEKTAHGQLHALSTKFVNLIQDILLPLFEEETAVDDITSEPVVLPTERFGDVHKNTLSLFLTSQFSTEFSDNDTTRLLITGLVNTPEFVEALNEQYVLMLQTLADDKLFMETMGLSEDPLTNLSRSVAYASSLPLLKTYIDVIFGEVRNVCASYYVAVDVNRASGLQVKKNYSSIQINTSLPDQVLCRFDSTNYLLVDSSIEDVDIQYPFIPLKIVDDKGNDCSSYVSLVGNELKMDAKAITKKYPDIKKLTISRSANISGIWKHNTLPTFFYIDSVEAVFVDEISFQETVLTNIEPENLFDRSQSNEIVLLLLAKVKEGLSEELPIELITKKKVATDEFITDLNGIYKLMWTQASGDKTFMKKKGLRDNPVADLAAFIDDITYLPSLKLKLDPLYRKVRDTVRIYEKSIDVSKDAGRWVQKKERKGVVLDPVSNNQLVRETGATTGPVDTDYLFHDATVIPQSATPYAGHTRKISVVDDQGNDCSSFVTLEGDGFHLKTQDLLRKHPDVAKLVITRPMVLSGEWCSNGIYVPIQGVEADFVDEISFGGLDNVVRMTLMTDFFNNRAQKEVLTRGLCASDATAACKSLLKSLFRKNYGTSQEKYIHEALRLEVTETVGGTPELDAESGFYTSCGIVPITYADRLIYAYLFEKANVSRTTSAYEVHIEELLATPKNLFTKKLDEDRFRELVTKIDFLIASQPTIDVDALLSDYTEGNVDVMNLLYAANQPHADAAKKTYVVNNFLDNVFGSEGYFGKKRRTFRLRRQAHSLLGKDRVKFWELDEVHDYWFIMGLGDNEGEERNKKVALSGEVVDYENIDVRIVITSATSIDVDIDVPAQKGSPSLKFDGARGAPDDIRAQMDSQITPDKGWDWKLGLGAKIQLEEHLYDRLVKQHGDVSSRITSTSAPPNSKLFTLSKGDSGMVIMDKSVIPPQTFTMEQCENERQAKVFLQLVRNILDNHCKSIKELLFNGATNPTDVILGFPKLSTIESANGSTPDDYEGERSEEKKFGATTVKVTYKSDEKGSYKLYVSDGIKEEEFDSVGEVVMSARYGSFALDLMHWFHEKLLEEFLLKRKDLPRDRTYFVQDPITQDRYGFYNEGNEIHYGVVSNLPNTGVKGLTTGQKMKDVDPDPKHRCVMSVGKATFVKGSEEIAKKTIFGRKDLFYSLLFTAMATSESGPKERDYREAQKKKRNESAVSLRNTVKDVSTWTALFDIVKTAFGSTKKK